MNRVTVTPSGIRAVIVFTAIYLQTLLYLSGTCGSASFYIGALKERGNSVLHISYLYPTYILPISYLYPTYILLISYLYPTYILPKKHKK